MKAEVTVLKIERINENKIRIVIESADIRAWNVDLKNFTANTPEAQDMFWHALKRAEQDVDFCVGKAQLMVETIPTADNGFVMLVSKLENQEEVAQALERTGKRLKQTEIKIRRRSRAHSLLRIFRFDDFEGLCSGAREINEMYIGESRLFKYQGEFFLELLPRDTMGLFELENKLSEFAMKVENPLLLQGVLNEHGMLMMESASVQLLSENFA